MKLGLFLLCSALVASCSQASIMIKPVSTSYALPEETFNFSCVSNTTDLTSLVVFINGQPAATDRLTNASANSKQYDFMYSGILPSDNGTAFMCQNRTQFSGILTMEVYYITFQQSATIDTINSSLWVEFPNSANFVVNCTAVGNPAVNISIEDFANNSGNFANVKFEQYNNVSGGFSFTKALVSNAGNFTCTATNEIETNSITYQVFVGGAPSNVTFTNVTVDYIDPEVFIQFNMTDVSDAPAKGVYIRVGDLEAALILFSEPNSNMSKMYSRKLTALLNETAPMLYNIELISFNDLGNGTIMSERMFIAGTNFSVKITTSNTNVSENTDFTITCTASIENALINLTVNGVDSSEVPDVQAVTSTNLSTTYKLSTAMPSNNGDVFMCMVTVEYLNMTSNQITINVLYAPRFQDFNNATRWLTYGVKSSFVLNCTLNSTGNPPSAGFRYTNITQDFDNVNATLGNTSLVYEVTNATVTNRVNLTCVANSSYATTTLTYLAFVGAGAPDKVKANITVNLRQGTVFLTLSVVDNSDAPAQHFFLNIPGIYNKTLSPKNYSNNYNYKNLLNKSAELFGNEDTHYLSVTAINDLGTAVVFNETVNVPVEPSATSGTMAPTSSPAPSGGSNAGAIAAGIIVPVVVLILIGFGAATAYYFYKKRKGHNFKLLSPTGADMDESVGHAGYGTHTKT